VRANLTIECVVDARALVGEGPLWDEVEQALWWTDIKGRIVHRFDPSSGEDRAFPMPIRVGAMALRTRGGFVLAAEHGFWFWDPATNHLEHVLDVEADRLDNRMNDGVCDADGRFIAASMNLLPDRPATAACWRLDASLRAEMLVDELHIGNGIAFTPDGAAMLLADTIAPAIWRYEYGLDKRFGKRSEFADMAGLAGKPDGAAFDAEGFYWIAGVYGGAIHRFDPEGRLDRTVAMPVLTPTCLRFGGSKFDDLYVTSMAENQPAPAGGVFRLRGLGVCGRPQPRFAG